jgi:hypothetical protein
VIRRFLLGLVLVAIVLAGLVAMGRWGRDQLRDDPRYAVALDEIDVPAPPGMTRGDFLAELRFLTRKDERFSALDPELPERLSALFGKHPWVAAVEGATVTPPKQVHVKLRFRKPTLAVPTDKEWRVVDETGVLLPASAPVEGLPKFVGSPKTHGQAGMPWGDPEVERQARVFESPGAKRP